MCKYYGITYNMSKYVIAVQNTFWRLEYFS